MPSRRRDLILAGVLAAARWPAAAARFPDRPIRIVVPFGPGGIADLTARTVAEHMAGTLGVAGVIENKPGAGSIVASQAVAGARPDGHTLLLMSNGHAVSVGLFRRLPYDPVRDFAPIGTLGVFDLGLFVRAGSRFGSLADLLAHARAHPGELNVGTVAPGSTQHLAARLFETTAGVKTLVVPYNGSPAVVAALRSGEIDVAVEIVGPMLPQVAAGAVRALAVTGGQANPALPSVPTVQQAGVAGYDVASWNALAAPAGTPPAAIDVIAAAAHAALAAPAVRDRLAALGVRLQPGSPQDLQQLLTHEIRRWGEVIRRAGIEPA